MSSSSLRQLKIAQGRSCSHDQQLTPARGKHGKIQSGGNSPKVQHSVVCASVQCSGSVEVLSPGGHEARAGLVWCTCGVGPAGAGARPGSSRVPFRSIPWFVPFVRLYGLCTNKHEVLQGRPSVSTSGQSYLSISRDITPWVISGDVG